MLKSFGITMHCWPTLSSIELHLTSEIAPPWRFWVGGRASFSGIASGAGQRAPRSQVVMPGGRGPGPPGADGYEPRPQDATPRSAFGSSPETAPQMSEDA